MTHPLGVKRRAEVLFRSGQLGLLEMAPDPVAT